MVSSSGEMSGIKALGHLASGGMNGPPTKRDMFDDADSSVDSRYDTAGMWGNVPGSPGRDPFADTDSSSDGSHGAIDSTSSPTVHHASSSAVSTCEKGCLKDDRRATCVNG